MQWAWIDLRSVDGLVKDTAIARYSRNGVLSLVGKIGRSIEKTRKHELFEALGALKALMGLVDGLVDGIEQQRETAR